MSTDINHEFALIPTDDNQTITDFMATIREFLLGLLEKPEATIINGD